MIRDDKQRVIGKLININSEKFTVELFNQSINFTINGFDDIYQYAQINGYVILPYQDFYIVAEIFGVRERDSNDNWRGEKEQILSKSKSVKYLDINPIGTIIHKKFKYGVSVFPTLYSDVLYIKKEELDIIFEAINDKTVIDEQDNSRLNLLDIGTSTIFPDYKIKLDINGFFAGHSSVLGNTGSGKSCTISSMVQTLFKKESFSAVGASFIFLDVNGEYHKAFSQIENDDIEVKYYSIGKKKSNEDFNYEEGHVINSNISYEEFKLPHWFLNIDEWALLLQASEKTQLPILRNALNLLSLFTGDKNNLNKIKNHILYLCILHILRDETSPPASKDRIIAVLSKFNTDDINLDTKIKQNITIRSAINISYGEMIDINSVIEYLEQEDNTTHTKLFYIDNFNIPTSNIIDSSSEFDEIENALELAILYEEAHGNKQIRDYCSSLITRYKSLKERKEFSFLTKSKNEVTKEYFINDILGLDDKENKKSQITILDLNSVEDEIVEVISCVLSRLIFDKLKTLEPRNSFPVNLVLEEAHRYISDKNSRSFGEANKIFDRVAKEGRKYGMFLLVSSQRPSELSKTVLSQCSNFIIHRIQNPDDLSHIRQMTPHISSTILSRLPSIPRQHALVFGHSVQIPTLFKVNEAKPIPHSSDNDITLNWFKAKNQDLIETSNAQNSKMFGAGKINLPKEEEE